MRIEAEYKELLKKVINTGIERHDRTKVGCLSTFNKSLKWAFKKGFPLMTSKKMYLKIFQYEFDWFINGETNIKRFKDNGVTIWDEWASDSGDLGPVYGHQLRNFNSQAIDQLKNLLNGIKTDPDSRRHIISLWNPAQIKEMALPPCYNYFQFFVDKSNKKISMFVVQRSADLFLGIPYDICLFSMLLLYVCEQTGYTASEVNLQMVDCHVYLNHLKQIKKYITNPSFELPKFSFKNGKIKIKDYFSMEPIKAPVAV